MNPWLFVIAVGAGTLALSLFLPTFVKPVLIKLGVMDVPSERSSHEKPVLRGLGLAVLIAMFVGYLVGTFFMPQNAVRVDVAVFPLVVIFCVAIASGLLGLGEDLRGVTVTMRSLFLLAIGLGGAYTLVQPSGIPSNIDVGWGVASGTDLPIWMRALLIFYAVLFISSYINIANFMDGLNGISGFHAVIAGGTFATVGYLTGLVWLSVAGIVLAVGFLGFLPFNLNKTGAFLGDVGSYLLGGAVAITSFAALMAGVPFLATIAPMVIYFGDVGVTLVKRVRKGHKWDEPHKEHVYQRINQLGYSHVQASFIAAGCTLATSMLGVISIYTAGWGSLVLFLLGAVVLITYLALPRILPKRTPKMVDDGPS